MDISNLSEKLNHQLLYLYSFAFTLKILVLMTLT